MFPSAALVIRLFKKSLTIFFCMFVLLLTATSLPRGAGGIGDSFRTTNAGKWSDTIGMARHGADQIYTIEKSGILYRTEPKNGIKIQVGKA